MHEKRNNVPKVDETVCPYCSKKFTNKYNCARHVKERCPDRPMAPNVALPPENVAPLSDLENKPYRCEQCYKMFVNRWNLKVHSKGYE